MKVPDLSSWRSFLLIWAAAVLLSSCSVTTFASSDPEQVLGQPQIESAHTRGKLRILSVLKIPAIEWHGLAMVELSGLAWSEDEKILYALSDHGVVFHLRPVFNEDDLLGVKLLNAYPLRDSAGADQSWPEHDSEGLVVLNTANGIGGDDELIVSYELRPRIQKHTSSGYWKENLKLPGPLEDVENYDGGNRALEAVAVHPDHGVLTIPEKALSNTPQDAITIYAASGKQWLLPQSDDEDLSAVAIEIMPDGKILLLQRRYRIFGTRWKSVLSRLTLLDNGRVISERLAVLSSDDEGLPVDNFEGLARHTGNRYFMVSDDNEHALQDTLLVYFEVVE